MNCDRLGGYDRSDPCKQTCLSETVISDEEACPLRCASQAKTMTFRSSKDQNEFQRGCTLLC